MAKRKSKKQKGRGGTARIKVKKPAAKKSGRAAKAAEPAGGKKPKGGSSKISSNLKSVEKKMLKAKSLKELRELSKQAKTLSSSYKRKSTRERQAKKFKNMSDTVRGVINNPKGRGISAFKQLFAKNLGR